MDREHGRGYSPRQVHTEGIYEARVQFEKPNEFQRIEDEVNRFFQRAGSRDPIINQIHEPSKYAEETKMLEFDDPYARIARSRGIIPSSYDRHLQKLIHNGSCVETKNRLRQFNNSAIARSNSGSRSPPLDSTMRSYGRLQQAAEGLPNKISITLEKVAANTGRGSRQSSRDGKAVYVEPTTTSTFHHSRDGRYTSNPSIRGWTAHSPSLEYSRDSPEGYIDRRRGQDRNGFQQEGYAKNQSFEPTNGGDRAARMQEELNQDPYDEDDDDPEFGPSQPPVNPNRPRQMQPAVHHDSDSDEEKRAMYEKLEKESKLAFQKSTRAKKTTTPIASKASSRLAEARSQASGQTDKDSLVSSQVRQERPGGLKGSQGPAQSQISSQQVRSRPGQDQKGIGDSFAPTANFQSTRPQNPGFTLKGSSNFDSSNRGEEMHAPRLAESGLDTSQRHSTERSHAEPRESNSHMSLRNLREELSLKNEQIKELKQQLHKMGDETTTVSGVRRPHEASGPGDDRRMEHILKVLKSNEEILVFAKQSLQQKNKWICRLQGMLLSSDRSQASANPDLSPPNDLSTLRELEEVILRTKSLADELEAVHRPPQTVLGTAQSNLDRGGSLGNQSNSSFEHQLLRGPGESQDKVLERCIDELSRGLTEQPTASNQTYGWTRWEQLMEKVQTMGKELFKLKLVEQTTNEKQLSLSKNNQVLENLLLAKGEEFRKKESVWTLEKQDLEKRVEAISEESRKAERVASSSFRTKVDELEQEIISLKAQLANTLQAAAQEVDERTMKQNKRRQGLENEELLNPTPPSEEYRWKQVHLALEYASSRIVGVGFTPSPELKEFGEQLKESPCAAVAHNFERFLEVERNHQLQLSSIYKEKFLNQNNFLQDIQLQLEVLSDILGLIEKYNRSAVKKAPEDRSKDAEKVVYDISRLLEGMKIDKSKLRLEIEYTNKTRAQNNALIHEDTLDMLEEYENSLKGMEFPEYQPQGTRLSRIPEENSHMKRRPTSGQPSEGYSRTSQRGSLFTKPKGPNSGEIIDLSHQKYGQGGQDSRRSLGKGVKEVASDSEPLEKRRVPLRAQKPETYLPPEHKESDMSMQQDALEKHSMRTEPLAEFDPDLLHMMMAQAQVIQDTVTSQSRERQDRSPSPPGGDEYL